jgi:hypothetical protein
VCGPSFTLGLTTSSCLERRDDSPSNATTSRVPKSCSTRYTSVRGDRCLPALYSLLSGASVLWVGQGQIIPAAAGSSAPGWRSACRPCLAPWWLPPPCTAPTSRTCPPPTHPPRSGTGSATFDATDTEHRQWTRCDAVATRHTVGRTHTRRAWYAAPASQQPRGVGAWAVTLSVCPPCSARWAARRRPGSRAP